MYEGGEVIQAGQRSFRSQISYVDLVGVLIASALMIVVFNSRPGAVVLAVIGVVWVALVLRSTIEVTDEGFMVRGLLRARQLRWSETSEFVVVGPSGMRRPLLGVSADYVASGADGQGLIGLSIDAIGTTVVSEQPAMLSVVAAVTTDGQLFRVHGTLATPLDPSFPAQAAAELNRALREHRAAATAEPGPALPTAPA